MHLTHFASLNSIKQTYKYLYYLFSRMVILRNEKLRRSWAGKRPSTVKEGEMQPAGEGNRVHDGSQGNEGSPVQSRQPSKRNAAKALDPAFAYQPVKYEPITFNFSFHFKFLYLFIVFVKITRSIDPLHMFTAVLGKQKAK